MGLFRPRVTDRSEWLRHAYEEARHRRDDARDALADAEDGYLPFLQSAYERLVVETNEAYAAWLESTW